MTKGLFGCLTKLLLEVAQPSQTLTLEDWFDLKILDEYGFMQIKASEMSRLFNAVFYIICFCADFISLSRAFYFATLDTNMNLK